MTHRVTPSELTAYRIGDPAGVWPIWDVGGALRVAGRWHQAGFEVIYASEHYSTALLEKLVHYNGALPPNQHYIEIRIPTNVSYEVVNPDALAGWDSEDGEATRKFGTKWYQEGRSAILIVPSVVARMEKNFVFNARHADFKAISIGLETPVKWDARLF